jgi:hypothetical protein
VPRFHAMVLALVLAATALTGSAAADDGDTVAPTVTHELRSDGPVDSQGRFTGRVTVVLRAADDGSGVSGISYRTDGGEWLPYEAPARVLLDGSPESLARWRQAGPGSFEPSGDGSVQTAGGLGMLWYPGEQFADVAITLQWRDARTDGCCSNGGVFVRFPRPETFAQRAEAPRRCEMHPLPLLTAEWTAVTCGHEIQINDGDTDPQQTGSVYNFQSLDRTESQPTEQGDWNDYEIRTEGAGDYTITVLRNGEVINRFSNTPGKQAARFGDPPTDARQFAQGYVGLQNHGAGDVIQYRDVRVRDLSPEAAAFDVAEPGDHTVEYRATDFAGNVSAVGSVTFAIAG